MVQKIVQFSRDLTKKLDILFQKKEKLLVNLPITQKLYDNLTLLAPTVWELLIPSIIHKEVSDVKKSYEIITVPPKLFSLCESLKLNVIIQYNDSQTEIFTLSPELGLIYTLQKVTIPRIFLALGMLQSCNLVQLKNLAENYYSDQSKLVNFLIELGSIRIYRSDIVWQLLKKYHYQDILGRFSLYVRDFIKDEFIYQKIM